MQAVSELSKGSVPEIFMHVKIYISCTWPHPRLFTAHHWLCVCFYSVSVHSYMYFGQFFYMKHTK